MKKLVVTLLAIALLAGVGLWISQNGLTIPSSEEGTAPGEALTYDQNSWKEIIPDNCTAYFDGCNNCRREPGAELAACTRKFCQEYQKPECLAEVVTMVIDSKMVDCVGVGPMQCMRVKTDEDADWQNFYDQIEGFDYEEGSTYTLKVEKSKRENVPADASSFTYKLVEVLSKDPA